MCRYKDTRATNVDTVATNKRIVSYKRKSIVFTDCSVTLVWECTKSTLADGDHDLFPAHVLAGTRRPTRRHFPVSSSVNRDRPATAWYWDTERITPTVRCKTAPAPGRSVVSARLLQRLEAP